MVHPSLVLKITELDKRYAGGSQFSYCIDFNFRDGEEFIKRRNWCWETWGPSYELKYVKRDNIPNWAWISDTHRTRLYFKGKEEIHWYKLRWE